MFLTSDLTSIRNQLDWKSGSDWTFHNYFYGGGNAFKGKAMVYNELGGKVEGSDVIISDSFGRSKALIPNFREGVGVPPFASIGEGYISSTSDAYNLYQYGGWFTPANGEEGFSGNVNDWWKYRFPKQAQVYNDIGNVKPIQGGKGVVNYLASNVKAPVSGLYHQPFQRRVIDVWGQGAVCTVPNNLYVAMPANARSWLFTLDVSTELIDSVVVVQSYIDVRLTEPLTISKDPDEGIAPGDYATVTAKLKNHSPFAGVVSVGITSPDNLQLPSSIMGGDGSLYFEADAEKEVELTVTNIGNLDEITKGSFKFTVVNQEPRETDSEEFELTFLPGLGIADTTLTIAVEDAESGESLGGINIRAEYGTNGVSQGTTTDGYAILGLGKFQGEVKLSASDPDLQYQPESAFTHVESGNNAHEFYLVKFGADEDGFDWWWILLAFIAVGTVALILGTRKKRRKTRRRRLPKVGGRRK